MQNNCENILNTKIISDEVIDGGAKNQSMLFFPQGLVGFADLKSFFLKNLEGELEVLLKMESLDAPELSFYILPVPVPSVFYATDDLETAFKALNFADNNSLCFVIVSAQKIEDEVVVRANFRAPILADILTRQAWQYVFVKAEYELRKEIARIRR